MLITDPSLALITKFLYERLSLWCNQCGIRFPDVPAGKKKLEGHLDMHFKQNAQAGQAGGQGHHRGWFISVEVRTSYDSLRIMRNFTLFRTGLDQ